jgi:hypothetical protein
MKVMNELMERREAEGKADHEKMMAKWEAHQKKKGSRLQEDDGQNESRPRRM